MAAPDEIEVEVAYALPGEQRLVRVRVPAGATVRQAIERSGVLARYSQLNAAPLRVGIFGKFVTLQTPLREGERVEIYRALTVDPKDARRRRAKIKKSI